MKNRKGEFLWSLLIAFMLMGCTSAPTVSDSDRERAGLVQLEKYVIDCSAVPHVPEGWEIRPEDQIKSCVTGLFDFNHSNVTLFDTEEFQSKGTDGYDLLLVHEGQPVLLANVLEYLLRYPELIPEAWKKGIIIFWGTIYRHPDGAKVVRFLRWATWDDSYYEEYLWLGQQWEDFFQAAVFAK